VKRQLAWPKPNAIQLAYNILANMMLGNIKWRIFGSRRVKPQAMWRDNWLGRIKLEWILTTFISICCILKLIISSWSRRGTSFRMRCFCSSTLLQPKNLKKSKLGLPKKSEKIKWRNADGENFLNIVLYFSKNIFSKKYFLKKMFFLILEASFSIVIS